jgi:3-oxoacyl-[acyl-carrier protein] reductase
MRAQKYGRIINVASTSGPVQAFVGDAAYHAAKAGMWGYTRACALETAADGITVNAIAPGWIATASQMASEVEAGLLTPMKRSGTPEEVAFAIRFLADPRASYITGQLLIVDGGNSVPEDRAWKP